MKIRFGLSDLEDMEGIEDLAELLGSLMSGNLSKLAKLAVDAGETDCGCGEEDCPFGKAIRAEVRRRSDGRDGTEQVEHEPDVLAAAARLLLQGKTECCGVSECPIDEALKAMLAKAGTIDWNKAENVLAKAMIRATDHPALQTGLAKSQFAAMRWFHEWKYENRLTTRIWKKGIVPTAEFIWLLIKLIFSILGAVVIVATSPLWISAYLVYYLIRLVAAFLLLPWTLKRVKDELTEEIGFHAPELFLENPGLEDEARDEIVSDLHWSSRFWVNTWYWFLGINWPWKKADEVAADETGEEQPPATAEDGEA